MKDLIKKSSLAAAFALASAGFLAPAYSAPFTVNIIDADTGFDCTTRSSTGLGCISSPDTADGAGNLDNNDELTWQEGVLDPRRSRLSLTELTPVNLTNVFQDVSKLTHSNFVISAPFNYSIDIANRFNIIDQSVPAEVHNQTDVFKLRFTETSNILVTKPEDCPGPNPVGTQCDDFFTLTGAALAPVEITAADGSKWIMEFNLRAGPTGAVVIQPDGTVLVYTGETEITDIFVQARIVPVVIPEPGSIALFGLALAGLGLARRRK